MMDVLTNMFRLNYLELDQTPRPIVSIKARFIIYFITIVFTTISAFLIWNSHLHNPSIAIQVACSMTQHRRLCFESISSTLQGQGQRQRRNCSADSSPSSIKTNSAADPSNIFALSLQVSISEVKKLLNPFLRRLILMARWEWTVQALTKCEEELEKSKHLLNGTLALIGAVDAGNQDFSRERKVSRSLIKDRILSASMNIDKCRSLLVFTEFYDEFQTRNEINTKMKVVGFCIDNSYLIFQNMDTIYRRLNPIPSSIGRILLTISHYIMVPSFVLNLTPYIFLGLLIFLMMKAKCFF